MVNVTEVENTLKSQNHRKLEAIFERQKELMKKYHPIEAANGLLLGHANPSTLTVDLDDRFGQSRIKDMAWRFTEEMGEADAALIEADSLHHQEECIDAMHFLVELSIISGFDAGVMRKRWPQATGKEVCLLDSLFKATAFAETTGSWSTAAWSTVASLGMTMNCLKNKPWKQTHHVTDREQFYFHLGGTWFRFISTLVMAGLSAESTFDLYVRKSEVNKFRQRSKY